MAPYGQAATAFSTRGRPDLRHLHLFQWHWYNRPDALCSARLVQAGRSPEVLRFTPRWL